MIMNLIVDVGNTRAKVAVFEHHNLLEVFFSHQKELIQLIKKIIKNYKISTGILSSVVVLPKGLEEELQNLVSFTILDKSVKLPFNNLYVTPKTLGVDRIALVAAASKKYAFKNVLIIDAGTCITFDFINNKNEYLGGAISPGFSIRYQSLHSYTSKLPIVEKKNIDFIIGKTTEESINIGVVNGVLNEIDGTINQYKKKYEDLTIVLTGGDTNFLLEQLKSSIFANQNFLLEGLNQVLIFNQSK